MVITDNRNSTLVPFDQIQISECFDFFGRVYMRISTAYKEAPESSSNAIALDNGDREYFEGNVRVTPLNVHLVIEDPWFPLERDSDLY